MEQVVAIVAVLITGPMVGVELGVAAFANPIAGRLPDEAFGQARGGSARRLGKVMPFWYVATLLVLIAAAFVTAGDWFLITAAAFMALAVVMTVTLLVPVNNRIGRWSGAADVDRHEARLWDRLHWRRVALLVAVFLLLVVGVLR